MESRTALGRWFARQLVPPVPYLSDPEIAKELCEVGGLFEPFVDVIRSAENSSVHS